MGEVTPVGYKAIDSGGKAAVANLLMTVTPLPPKANPDSGSGAFCTAVTVSPLTNDVLGNKGDTWKSVTLLDAQKKPVSTLVTDKGTYVVKGTQIVFTPKDCAYGNMPPVPYRAVDSRNAGTDSTVTVTIAPPAKPVAKPDRKNGQSCTPTTVDVLPNDVLGNPGDTWKKVELLDNAGTVVPSIVTNDGTFTVVGNKVVFTPKTCAYGTMPTIKYRATDSRDGTADSTVVVVLPEAKSSITLDKRVVGVADGGTVNSGDTKTFEFVVTNTGETTLAAGATITDDVYGKIPCTIPELAPGQQHICRVSKPVTKTS